MTEKLQQCPSCALDLQQGVLELTFCPRCRFPLMVIAGKYRLEKVLAEGGFGFVYLAHHVGLEEKKRVIKVIKPEIFAKENVEARFHREVQITTTLSEKNDHIVRIYDDFGEEPNLGHYYVMEYLKGMTLKQFLSRDGMLPFAFALHLFRQMCVGMKAAHEAGIVHRDLKPDNLFLIQKQQESHFVKIIDFGIARPTKAKSELTKGVLGTPYYMSPEQCLGKAVDKRADIYSMGIILYEMLTGKKPYVVDSDEDLVWLMAHVHQEPIPLAVMAPEAAFPLGLDDVVLRALAKTPEQRYPDVASFWEALLPFAAQFSAEMSSLGGVSMEPLPALPTGASTGTSFVEHVLPTPDLTDERETIVMGEPVFESAQSTSPKKEPLRVPVVPLLVGLLVIVLLVGGGWWLYALGKKQSVREVGKLRVTSLKGPRPPKAKPRMRAVVKPRKVKKPVATPPKRNVVKQPEVRRSTLSTRPPVRPFVRRKVKRKKKRGYYTRRIVRYRGGYDRAGNLRTRGVWRKPKLLWRTKTGGLGRGAPIVAHGRVYVGSNRGVLRALDRKTGDVLWKLKTRDYASRGSWAWMAYSAVGNELFVTNKSSDLFIVDAHKGTIKRTFSARYVFLHPPLVYKRAIYFTEGRLLRSYDHVNKSMLWSYRMAGRVYHPIALYRSSLVYSSNDDTLTVREMGSGRFIKNFRFKSDVSAVALYRHMAFAGSDKDFSGINLRTLKKMWTIRLDGWSYSPIVYNGVVMVTTTGKRSRTSSLYGVRARDGKILWETKRGRPSKRMVVAGGVVLHASYGKRLVARHYKTGRILWSIKLNTSIGSAPFVDQKTVYVHGYDGYLYAFR